MPFVAGGSAGAGGAWIGSGEFDNYTFDGAHYRTSTSGVEVAVFEGSNASGYCTEEGTRVIVRAGAVPPVGADGYAAPCG